MSPPSAQPWTFDTGAPALHGQQFAAAQERAAVLLTHGYAEHAGRYRRVIEALNGAGISVYSYDLRGHGQSPGRRSVVDVDVLVNDHLKAREALRGLNVPLFAFGHSMGGLITAASVLRDPRGLRGAVLSSPALLVGEGESEALKALSGVLGRLFPTLPVTALESGGLSRIAEEVSAYDNDPQVYRGKVPALTAASMLRVSRQLKAQYPQWRLPTLVLHGSEDKLADVRGSRQFAETAGTALSPRPEIEYLEIGGGYHELFNDLVREEVTARLLDWLDRQLA
ncbi:alpha/beta hydrolase [Deinococcus irradiatisoli]|uniref:Alpha/beta hydrolase n=1 Tax=Deinococcus irradiatisoli TaxID=2202254 RepID=A0A2Z3JC12_9DEIO|nr:alpha/beta hydrolase [Deinococcus irradiatisoli]AWN22572.1 alpha/beta hydrolase [Deinococcus irradiatisoli]